MNPELGYCGPARQCTKSQDQFFSDLGSVVNRTHLGSLWIEAIIKMFFNGDRKTKAADVLKKATQPENFGGLDLRVFYSDKEGMKGAIERRLKVEMLNDETIEQLGNFSFTAPFDAEAFMLELTDPLRKKFVKTLAFGMNDSLRHHLVSLRKEYNKIRLQVEDDDSIGEGKAAMAQVKARFHRAIEVQVARLD
jgi:hypothetical protein